MMLGADLVAFLLRLCVAHACAIFVSLLLCHELRTIDLHARLSRLLRFLLRLLFVLGETERGGQCYRCGGRGQCDTFHCVLPISWKKIAKRNLTWRRSS